MNCDDCQSRICDLLDAGKSIQTEVALEMHLAECATCREFHDVWAGLDARLTRHNSTAALPEDFKATLMTSLPAPRPRLMPAEVALRRTQYEREYRQAMAPFPGRYLSMPPARLLWLLSLVAGLAMAGFFLPEVLRAASALAVLAFGSDSSRQTMLLFCWSLGLASLLYGLRHSWHSLRHHLPHW